MSLRAALPLPRLAAALLSCFLLPSKHAEEPAKRQFYHIQAVNRGLNSLLAENVDLKAK